MSSSDLCSSVPATVAAGGAALLCANVLALELARLRELLDASELGVLATGNSGYSPSGHS